MNGSIRTGIFLVTILATAGSVIAGISNLLQKQPHTLAYADVLHVEPVTRSIQTSREICKDIPLIRQPKDRNKIVGRATNTLLGAVTEKRNNEAGDIRLPSHRSTEAGVDAVHDEQSVLQVRNASVVTERNCYLVEETHEVLAGYDIIYRLEERQGIVRLARVPGNRIPLVNGKPLGHAP